MMLSSRICRGIVPESDDLFASVQYLLPMTGADGSTAFTDVSNFARTFTGVGTAQIAGSEGRWGGGGGKFTVNGDHIYIAATADLGFGYYPWVLEFWAKPDSASDAMSKLVAATKSWGIGVGTNGVRVQTSTYIDYATAIPTDEWTHIALQYVNTAAKCELYLNGTRVINLSSDINVSAGYQVQLGSPVQFRETSLSSLARFTGYLSDIRFTKARRYLADFSPPTAPYPQA